MTGRRCACSGTPFSGARNGPLVLPLGCEMTHPYGLIVCLKGKISKASRREYFSTVELRATAWSLLGGGVSGGWYTRLATALGLEEKATPPEQ